MLIPDEAEQPHTHTQYDATKEDVHSSKHTHIYVFSMSDANHIYYTCI
jgi:hypothetical protein